MAVGRLSIICRGSTIEITQNGYVTVYRGSNGTIRNGDIFIDGTPVSIHDERIISQQPLRRSNNAVEHSQPRLFEIYNRLIRENASLSSAPQANELESSSDEESSSEEEVSSARFNRILESSSEEASSSEEESEKHNIPVKNLHKFSPFVAHYIKQFYKKPKFSDRLNKLKISEEEKGLLEKFCDPITQEYIDIPVFLNGKLYDLSTLLDIISGNAIDPFTRDAIKLTNIEIPREDIASQIELAISRIKLKRTLSVPNSVKADKLKTATASLFAHTRNYITLLINEEKLSAKLEKLQLTPTEMEKLAFFRDPVTQVYMDIPVSLNGKFYDLYTLVAAFNENKKDPSNDYQFELSNLGAARDCKERVEAVIEEILSARNLLENPSMASTSSALSSFSTFAASLAGIGQSLKDGMTSPSLAKK